jgi:hypothetical protein
VYLIIPLFVAVLTGTMCKRKIKNQDIFEGLEKSYILNKYKYENQKEFFEEYKVDYSTFKKDSIYYENSLQKLISSPTEIIEDMLIFEGNEKLCFWVKTLGPYSSNVDSTDLLSKSTAAKILLDNYILNSGRVIIRPYVYKIEYSWLKSWYDKIKTREELKKEYQSYAQSLSKQ